MKTKNEYKKKGGGIKTFLIILFAVMFTVAAAGAVTKGVSDKWPWEYLKKSEAEIEGPESDGKSHLFITLNNITDSWATDVLKPALYFTKSNISVLNIDWGDGTEADTVSTSGIGSKSHAYAEYGSYEITVWISVGGGTYTFGNGNSSNNVFGGSLLATKGILTSCIIGNDVITIGDYAFTSCSSLRSVQIPVGVSSIGNSAFYSCYSLNDVRLSNGVMSIGNAAFYNCYSLIDVRLPNSVTSIGNNAFYNCYSLKNIIIPNGVTVIGSDSFVFCYSLTSVVLPGSVASIGSGAFKSCYALTVIISENIAPPTITSNATSLFYDINFQAKIYVPDASIDAYKTAKYWTDYIKYFYPMSELPA